MSVIAVLARASYRDFRRHPWQVLLAAVGVALGVAVVTAVDLTKTSARQALADATASVIGNTTHHIVGGPRGLDETLYAKLRRSGVVRDLAPVIEANVNLLQGDGGQSLRLLGVDPIAESAFRGYWAQLQGESSNGGRLMTQPGTALVSRALLKRLNLTLGCTLRLAQRGQVVVLAIIGLLDPQGRQPALAGTELVVVDIATAQEMLGMIGRLSRIDAIVESPRQAAALRALIGGDAELIAAQTQPRRWPI